MNEHTQPAHVNKFTLIADAIDELVAKQLKLHGATLRLSYGEEWLKDYGKSMGKIEQAIEQYVQVRVFIALRKYVEENNKAA